MGLDLLELSIEIENEYWFFFYGQFLYGLFHPANELETWF
jgi:hypothetical protein